MSDAHLRTVALLSAVTFFTTTLIDFQFKVVAADKMKGDELAAYFGYFSATVGALALVLQLFGTSRLLNRAGVIGSLAWYQWWDEARNGGDARRTVSVTLLDEQGNPAMRWRFLRARPAGYLTSPMDAALGQTLFETLEIAFDRFEVE